MTTAGSSTRLLQCSYKQLMDIKAYCYKHSESFLCWPYMIVLLIRLQV